ncbi:hypothetical protein HDU98_012234 [Podochytrium sp. JEL0797]|nr:hypothetical protein HDU98_012234 [Podochytrium sp. JEL0797]
MQLYMKVTSTPAIPIYLTDKTVESLLLIQNIGLQTRTTRGFTSSTRFIPANKISEIVVNEAITLFQVKYYMAVIVDGEKEMLVVFGSCLPKLKFVKHAFWESRRILLGDAPPAEAMSSMRDAMQRLQVIYENCVPEAIAAKQAELGLDEFQRLKKKIAADVKGCRQALKEREDMLCTSGTTPETAEASYKIRIMIRNLKEGAGRMAEICKKEEKKKSKDANKMEKLALYKEVLDLTNKHIEEVESLEKRRFNEGYAMDRSDLMAGATNKGGISSMAGGGMKGNYGGNYGEGKDPFNNTELPDIDVEEDFKRINEKNQAIDQDLEEIGQGVQKLKELAQNMGNELERQNDDLEEITKAADKALDHVDNVNVQMRKAVDGMMAGDKFMMNCILMCVLLALLGFIASLFTK